MVSRLIEIFEDKYLRDRIASKLPYLFQIAELESSRAGKTGMEVGSLRERIIVALLIYKFGEENVETEVPITEPEIDVYLFGYPICIKTITGVGGVKIAWTVDAQKAREFSETYVPKCDILLAQIIWNDLGNLFYIPLEVQKRIFKEMGREKYIKLPKPGTNPRGVEYSKEALLRLMRDSDTKSIKINWQRSKIDYKPYQRWVDYWKE
ncbi:ThaI family type II restriction endonuclease [Candidatus Bathyarchaeota archaeon]|nr:ThaI family type II restriction endonuclease [Candidatus Bathyarchaeota archaeon]